MTRIVKAWEQAFLKVLKEWDTELFDYAYYSEVMTSRTGRNAVERQNRLLNVFLTYVFCARSAYFVSRTTAKV